MPPKSSKNGQDDAKGDPTSTKDNKNNHVSSNSAPSSSKMRRGASSTGGSQLREVTNASSSSKTTAGPGSKSTAVNLKDKDKDKDNGPIPGIDWSSFDRDMLHAYRRGHRLDTPTCFSSSYRHMILSQPGSIGMYSPTMLRRRDDRRQSKEQLALKVRKHFNGVGVQENDVIVDFIHKVRSHSISKCDRLRRRAPSLDISR